MHKLKQTVPSLDTRDKRGMEFTAHAKTVRIDQLAQLFAPSLAPATDDEPRRRLRKDEPKPPTKDKGGAHPWPAGRYKRVAATLPIVQDWVNYGFALKLRPYRDMPMWVMLTSEGERWLGLNYKPIDFPAGLLEHIYIINEIRLFLLRSSQIPPHIWISERELEQNEPLKTLGLKLPHRPDGVIIPEESRQLKLRNDILQLESGERIAIEAERSRKNYKDLEENLPNLLAHYDRAWYFATPSAYDAVSEARDRFFTSSTDKTRLHIFRLSSNWWEWKREEHP